MKKKKLRSKQNSKDYKRSNLKSILTNSRMDKTEASIDRREHEAVPAYNKMQAKHHRSLAKKLLEGQNYEDAIVSFEQAISLAPTNWQAYFGLGEAYTAIKCYKKAQIAFQKALQFEPKNSQIHWEIGEMYFKQNLLHDANSAYQAAIKYDPQYSDQLVKKTKNLLTEGQQFSQLKQYKEAINYFDIALFICPDKVTAMNIHLEKGDAFAQLKCYQEALNVYKLALPSVRTYQSLGDALFDLKRFKEALVAEEQALLFDSKTKIDSFVCRELRFAEIGCYLFEQQDYQDALVAYERAAQLNPRNVNNILAKGNIFIKTKRYGEAFSAYQQAMNVDQISTRAYFHEKKQTLLFLGREFLSEEYFQEARWFYQISAKHDVDVERDYAIQGEQLLDAAKKLYENECYPESSASFRKAIEFNPEYQTEYLILTEDLVDRAKRCLDDGHLRDGLANFAKAIQFNPSYASAYEGRGDILFTLEDYADAYDTYLKAAQLLKMYSSILQTKGRTLVTMGKVAHEQGELQKALRLLDYAIKYDSRNISAYDAQIQLQSELGEKEEVERIKRIKYQTFPDSRLMCEEPFRYEI